MHAEDPERPVVIQTHPASSTRTLVAVMDASRQANVYNISIAEGV
jgi:biopolymer transport protein ExbD